MLHGLKSEGKASGDGEQTIAARFSGKERVVYVVWTTITTGQVVIPLEDDERIVAVYDIMGRRLERSLAPIVPTVDVGLSPQYVIVERRGDT